MSRASNAAANRYRAANYDRILLQVPKGRREDLRRAAEAAGAGSLSAWLLGLAERETGLELVLRGELPYKKGAAGADPAENPPEQAKK